MSWGDDVFNSYVLWGFEQLMHNNTIMVKTMDFFIYLFFRGPEVF